MGSASSRQSDGKTRVLWSSMSSLKELRLLLRLVGARNSLGSSCQEQLSCWPHEPWTTCSSHLKTLRPRVMLSAESIGRAFACELDLCLATSETFPYSRGISMDILATFLITKKVHIAWELKVASMLSWSASCKTLCLQSFLKFSATSQSLYQRLHITS